MTYDDIKRRYADGYHMTKSGQAIEDVGWLMHAYAAACAALDGRDRIERERDELRDELARLRATNAKLHRRTQAAEAAIADTLREAAKQVAAADERARAAESLTATVRRARAFVAARHAEVDTVAAALVEADGLRSALREAQRELDELRDSLPARVLHALGVADGEQCPRCQGVGRYTYATTATWRGGYGGQAFAVGTCDRCWGSGTTEPWPSLREQADEAQQLRAALAEVLGWMTESGHPGEDCLRSGWVQVQRVADLLRLVDGGR